MITQINYNWFVGDYGEEFSNFCVGHFKNPNDIKSDVRVVSIMENPNNRSYVINFSDGSKNIVFNVNQVFETCDIPTSLEIKP